MIYLRAILFGLGTVLLGCLIAPVAFMIRSTWSPLEGATTMSFSPMGLASHLAHSLGFWIFIVVLFAAGFIPAVFLSKR